MATARQRVYVISDLHLGGAPPASPGERGFQLCTQIDALAAFINQLAAEPVAAQDRLELVVNGDFVDFLAEATPPGAAGGSPWSPVKEDPQLAQELLSDIAHRNRAVFAALSALQARGHTLTLLLGNHDIELAYPRVRAALAGLLGVPPTGGLRLLHDGEAYRIGDALIEHGNRYDRFNVVDHDALRRVCSLQSRNQRVPEDLRLLPPVGSQIVAEVMNPIKKDYPFIDLLKPESAAAVPLLLALEPGVRGHAARMAMLAYKASQHTYVTPAMPKRSGDISATVAPGGAIRGGGRSGDMVARVADMGGRGMGAPVRAPAPTSEEADLQRMLVETLGEAAGSRFLSQLGDGAGPQEAHRGDIAARSSSSWAGRFSLMKLFFGGEPASQSRLDALHTAMLAFCDPSLFDPQRESEQSPYLLAARELAQGEIRHVVMGHTHLMRDIPLPSGGRYLNSGTWADLMRVPDAVLAPDRAAARAALQSLVEDIKAHRFHELVWRRPSYARLELADGRVREASVHEYSGGNGAL
jgi:UDP-2,3-diacylglucosamine pyrophosphatase LpxH